MLKHNNRNSHNILGFMSVVAFLAIASVLLNSTLLMAGDPAAVAELKTSPNSMDFYGYVQDARAGDEITVYDKDGTLCGRFTLSKDGQYGFLHVYGDDTSTKVDEGAGKNEPLTFRLNGQPLFPASSGEAYWLGDGKRQRLDFIKG